MVTSKAMTKAARLHSSPHLDCNKTYLGHPLTSSSATALWQPHCFGTVLFELCQETWRSWLFGWPSHSLCDGCPWQERRKKRQKENGGEISVFLFEMVNEMVLCRCPAHNTCKGSSCRSTSLLHVILAPSPSPHTQKHIRATSLFEREMGGTHIKNL